MLASHFLLSIVDCILEMSGTCSILGNTRNLYTVTLGYVMKGTEYFVSYKRVFFLTEECVNSGELIGTTEYLDAIDEVSHKPMSL
jgi:hypothetical protein